MSTIKSSAENLTLNADGANNDIKFQSNGSEVASIDQAGLVSAASIATTGSVGIGTTSAAGFKLDIQDSNYGVRVRPVPASNFVQIQLPTNEGSAVDTEKFIIAYNNAHSGNPHTLALKSNNSAGNLGFFTNNSERMTIDSAGAVTMPAQPCVSARATYTNIPVNATTVVTLDSERFDIGSDLASGTFTAPVTGKYLYTYTLYFSDIDTAATALGVQVVTSNKQYENWISPDHIANADFNYTFTSSQIADMDANDTLQFKVYCGGGAAQTDIHADSMISIALIA